MSINREFLRTKVYDLAVNAGSSMIGRVDKSTVSNIISVFLGRSDVKEALNELILYIARQVGRNEIPRSVGRQLLTDIHEIHKVFKDDDEMLREALAKYLVLIKWVYDSNVRGAKNLNELVNKFVGGSS